MENGALRIAFIGAVASSYEILRAVHALGAEVTAVITRKVSPQNSDHVDLAPFCQMHAIPCIYAGPRIDDDALAFLKSGNPEYIFCMGWSSLLPHAVLAAAPGGAVGFHPAPLPLGRGRHPIIWALALGLTETASTFFLMDEGADSGDILHQKPVPISKEDTAETLYAKILKTALCQLEEMIPLMRAGRIRAVPQDHTAATYWRKRTKADGCIDFRMPAGNVYNLVRALSAPYPGAHVMYAGTEIKVWRAEPVAWQECYHEPGKVLASSSRGILVKCGLDAILLTQHEFPVLPLEGSYIL